MHWREDYGSESFVFDARKLEPSCEYSTDSMRGFPEDASAIIHLGLSQGDPDL